MSAVQDVLSQVRISKVYAALTGITPRQTGRNTWRGPAVWRGGDGKDSVSGDDARGVWHDWPTDERGGILDLVIRIRGGSRAGALCWTADLAGIPLDDRPLSPEARQRWAAERRAIERYLEPARLWRRVAVVLGEAVSDYLKAALADPMMPRPEVGEIARWWRQVERWRRVEGGELVKEYREWAEREPRLTAGMVYAARNLEAAEMRALRKYLTLTAAEVAT